MFKSTITAPLALWGLGWSENGELQGKVEPFNFMHGETRNSGENTLLDVGSVSPGLPSLESSTYNIRIPQSKFLSEQF